VLALLGVLTSFSLPPLGDGLESSKIWNDEGRFALHFNGSRIRGMGRRALLPVNAAAEYEVEAADPHASVGAMIALA
jgi:Tfp pilus assembly protein FimT